MDETCKKIPSTNVFVGRTAISIVCFFFYFFDTYKKCTTILSCYKINNTHYYQSSLLCERKDLKKKFPTIVCESNWVMVSLVTLDQCDPRRGFRDWFANSSSKQRLTPSAIYNYSVLLHTHTQSFASCLECRCLTRWLLQDGRKNVIFVFRSTTTGRYRRWVEPGGWPRRIRD